MGGSSSATTWRSIEIGVLVPQRTEDANGSTSRSRARSSRAFGSPCTRAGARSQRRALPGLGCPPRPSSRRRGERLRPPGAGRQRDSGNARRAVPCRDARAVRLRSAAIGSPPDRTATAPCRSACAALRARRARQCGPRGALRRPSRRSEGSRFGATAGSSAGFSHGDEFRLGRRGLMPHDAEWYSGYHQVFEAVSKFSIRRRTADECRGGSCAAPLGGP